MKSSLFFLLFVYLLGVQSSAQDRVTGSLYATRSEVIAQNGMVASSQPLATQIGLDILKNGGNAIDAAIATNAALGLMEPTGCGIGGDLFALIDFHMNLQEAGDAPRWDHTCSSTPTGEPIERTGEIRVESGIPYKTVRGLMMKRHEVGYAHGVFGGYQAIMWDSENKVYRGASESRKDGQAAGY